MDSQSREDFIHLAGAMRQALAGHIPDSRPLNEAIKSKQPIPIWRETRRYYESCRHLISGSKEALAIDPYAVNWMALFSPIEYEAWNSLREYGLPFYPQYPISKYFADFADPHSSLVIECDGDAWHDKSRDQTRDEAMKALGWQILRIPGRQFYAPPIDMWAVVDFELEGDREAAQAMIYRWATSNAHGAISAIAHFLYGHVIFGVNDIALRFAFVDRLI